MVLKKILVGALLSIFCFVPSIFGDDVNVGDYIKFWNGPGSPGGEFGVYSASATPSTYADVDFITFCLEKTEFLNFSATFYVESISQYAMEGGVGPSGDELDEETAWLYWNFRMGTLSAGSYTYNGTASSANALQAAIWKFEGEITTSLSGEAKAYYDAAAAAVSGANGWRNNGRVAVMNLLWNDENGKIAQDQLILTPEPTGLILLGMGLIGIAIYLYRHKSKLS